MWLINDLTAYGIIFVEQFQRKKLFIHMLYACTIYEHVNATTVESRPEFGRWITLKKLINPQNIE